MIQVINNDLKRGGTKIGWIEGDSLFDYTGKKVGMFYDNKIFNYAGDKIGYIEEDFIFTLPGDTKIRIEDNIKEVSGGSISDLARAAVRLLLG